MSDEYRQSFRQETQEGTDISIYSCGLQKCRPGHSWGPGIRDHYLIHLVVSGKGIFKTGSEEYSLGSGDLFLIRPNQLIEYTADRNEPWEYYWVAFNGANAGRLVQQLPFSVAAPVHHCTHVQTVQSALRSIYLAHGEQVQNEVRMTGYLYLFLSELIDENPQEGPRQTNAASQYVMNAVKYIQYNYSHELTIDDIAKAVGVSRSHLYRVFISTVGKSPIDYLTEYRIREACSLLKGNTLSIAEIAASVGFYDQFYFSRVFKKATGYPPSKYVAYSGENGGS